MTDKRRGSPVATSNRARAEEAYNSVRSRLNGDIVTVADLNPEKKEERIAAIQKLMSKGGGRNGEKRVSYYLIEQFVADDPARFPKRKKRSLGTRLRNSGTSFVRGGGKFVKDVAAPLAIAAYGGMALDGALTAGAAGASAGTAGSGIAAGTAGSAAGSYGVLAPSAGAAGSGIAAGTAGTAAAATNTVGGFLSSDLGKTALLQVGSGLYGANRANKASDQLVDATNRATDTANQQFEQTMSNLQPYMESGIAGNEALLSRLGITMGADGLEYGGSPFQDFSFDPNNLENTPGYQFRLNQGLKGIQRSASAKGMLGSGNMMTALTDYAQGLASQEYQAEYNRQLTDYTTNFKTDLADLELLQNLSGSGQNAAIGAGNLNTQFSNILADLKTQLGRDQASGTMGESSSLQNMFSDIGGAYLSNKYFGNSPPPPIMQNQNQTYNPYLEYGSNR